MGASIAVIVGANGGIGGALIEELKKLSLFDNVIGLGREELDLCDEASIVQATTTLPKGAYASLSMRLASYMTPTIAPKKACATLPPRLLPDRLQSMPSVLLSL